MALCVLKFCNKNASPFVTCFAHAHITEIWAFLRRPEYGKLQYCRNIEIFMDEAPQGGGGFCAPLIPENNALISPAP